MTVSDLRPEEHRSTRARIDGHEGRLVYTQNPTYTRVDARHWWLFTDDAARSLQWAGSKVVELLTERPDA